MQLVPDGPDIPLEILDAQEEGKLALFVGAGVSVPNGLPLFEGLVEGVREELGASWKPEEKQAYSAKQYDRVLGLLEREHRFPGQVRPAVQKQLVVPDNPYLDTHNALLDLARTDYGSGDLHLVTTNFDRLFEATEKDYEIASAPGIPVPKPKKWNELVYLHGFFGRHDPDGRRLVLTSADFGIAYLTERWASRFVSELFNHFTVLFVGYSVNDPVMRYLVDAIAADREQGIDERLHEAYAFASFKDGQREQVKNEWETKNIVPLLYPEDNNHKRLHDTLLEWAQLWRGGLKSKKNLVTLHGTKSPETLTEEISQVQWAMSDPPAARKFAGLKSEAPFDWLYVFEENGFTHSAVTEERLEANIPLVDGGSNTDGPQSLSEVTSAVADWLTAHLDKSDLIHWVIRKGGHLHPEFRRKIQSKLADGGLSQPHRTLWQVLAGSEPFFCSSIGQPYLVNRLSSEEWNSGLRADLLSALTPCLELRPRGSHDASLFLESGVEREDRESMPTEPSDLVRMNLGIQSHFPGLLEDRLEDREDKAKVLRDVAFDLTQLLQQAMELFELFGRVGRVEDAIHIQRPSIRPHDQNSDHHDWGVLVDLLRKAVSCLAEDARSEARILARLFVVREYPLFRRFALYAYEESALLDPETLLMHLLEDPVAWVWATSIQVEFFRALPRLWDALDSEGRTRLADTIIEGPPRTRYREDISDDEWDRLRDRAIWNRLVRIRHSSEHDLTESGQNRLEEIEEQFPEWEYTGTEREDFPFWTEVGWGYETDYPAESLLDRTDEKIVDVLLNQERHRRGLVESWREAVKLDPHRAIGILEILHEQGGYREDIWKSSVRGFREVEVQEEHHAGFLDLVGGLPNDLVETLAVPLSSLLETIAKAGADELEGLVLSLWDRLWPAAVEHEVRGGPDLLSTAINHPAGKLAEVLLQLLRERKLTKRGGIDAELQSRIEDILDGGGEAIHLARVVIASRLALLHFLDPEWTEENLVPLFDWTSSSQARFAWSGYLWSPTMPPDLWPAIKPYFLSTFENLHQLSDTAQRSLAVLLVAIALQDKQALSEEEARECLRRVNHQGRTEVARWLVRRLEGAEERVDTLWTERIGPWLEVAWPQEAEFRSSQTSVLLAWAAIETRDAFPAAVDAIESRITPLDQPAHVLDKLADSEHPASHPEPSLKLLDILIDDISFRHIAEALQRCLEEISTSDPSLEADPRYVRLLELVQQYI